MKRIGVGGALGAVSTLALLAALGGQTATAAPAQDESKAVEKETEAQAQQRLALAPDVVTVTATRRETDSFDEPLQITVVERERLEDLNVSGISDVFDVIPGAQIDGGPRRTGQVPSVRGAEGESVLVLIDGARQSFLSGHDGRFFIEPELLKSVEVVRGPSSALYGSGAVGGVIALRTVDASDLLLDGETVRLIGKTGYASVADEFRVTGIGAFDAGLFDGVGSITYRESSDIELGSGLDLPADNEIVSGLAKVRFEPLQDVEISATYLGYRDDARDPANPQGTNISNPANPEVDRDVVADNVQGRLAWTPDTPLIDLRAVLYYGNTEVEEAETQSPRVVLRQVESIGLSLDNRSVFDLGGGASLSFIYGLDLYQDEQTGEDNTSPDGTRGGVPDATATTLGLFIQAEAAIAEPFGLPGEFRLTPALRYDAFENEAKGNPDTDDSALSPKIAAAYEPIDGLFFFASYADAFRAPSFNEIYADGVHFPVPVPGTFPPVFVNNTFIPNPDLQPEESSTWEVGAGLDRADVLLEGDRFTVKGSYWWSDVNDLISLDVFIPPSCFGAPVPPPCITGGTSQNVNVTNAELSGFEMEATYDTPRWRLRANVSGIDGEDEDTGGPVGVLYPTTAFAEFELKLPEIAARLGVRGIIAEDFDDVDSPTERRDGYGVMDLYAVWEPQGTLEGLRVDLGVDNVFDEDYEVVAAGVSQPGRDYKITVSYGFGW